MWFLCSFALWRDQQINLFSFFGLLAAPGGLWGPPGGPLGGLLCLLGLSWAPPRASSDLLRRSWSLVGLMLGFLNPTWALQGINFGPAGAHCGFPGDQNRQNHSIASKSHLNCFQELRKSRFSFGMVAFVETTRSSRSIFQKHTDKR